MADARNFGEKTADGITQGMGTWKFIIGQSVFTMCWIVLNSMHGWGLAWDSYPFVLLNLVYSFQAGFTGPILLLSQNRQVARDSTRLEQDLAADMEALNILNRIVDHLGIEE